MNILVIGSKGFIGSHCLSYLANDNKVYACDIVTDYAADNYYQIDATNADYKEVFNAHQFDVCVNCSGAASVPDSFKHPLRDFSLNVYNVIKILEAIKELQPECKFINLSSAAVYGAPKKLPITENTPLLPVSPYGFNKKHAEEIAQTYAHFFGIQTCSLRIFSAYGPGLKKQLLWDIFIKSRKSKEVVLFGTGNETRDFIYVDDIAKAIKTIIKKGDFNAGVYNVACGKAITVNDIALRLLSKLNYKGEILYSETNRVGDPAKWESDITPLKSLGFEPDYDIEKGIDSTVIWLNGLGL